MRCWRYFNQMRGDPRRTWHRRSDVLNAAVDAGLVITWHDAKKAIAHLPKPEKRYGHFRYTDEHRDAVLAYGRAMIRRVV